jgi:hypothetical protein
MDHL